MTADEVLKQMQIAATLQSENPVCVIDAQSRTITVPEQYKLFGVENDKRVERVYFQCPKIVGDNQDLSQGYQLFMNYQNANGDPDAYRIDDMTVEVDNITFSWLLEENVTKYKGNIKFAFGAIKPGDELLDPDKNRWNTTINTDCTCLVGLKSTQQVAESNPDALAQIWAAIDELKSGGGGTGGTTNYNNLSNKPQLNGVTLEGNKTLDQVGVLAKNQGSSNSGKYLSVGSDGNVVPADAPSGGIVDPEQIKQAVNGYLEENPVSGMTAEQEQQLDQNTTDVADLKSALEQKGLPAGGTTGQVLAKKTDSDYDVEWKDVDGGNLSKEKINSLYELIKICTFTENPTEKIKTFEIAWGIEPTEPPEGTEYSITRSLTNCTSSSSLETVIEGQSINEKITANSGFELSNVIVMMGGADITSTVYSDGGISIASVSGDIEITAVAEQEATDIPFNMTMNRVSSEKPNIYSDEGSKLLEKQLYNTSVWFDSENTIQSDGVLTIKFVPKNKVSQELYIAQRNDIEVSSVDSFYNASVFTTNEISGGASLQVGTEYEISAPVKSGYICCLVSRGAYNMQSINAKLKTGGVV